MIGYWVGIYNKTGWLWYVLESSGMIRWLVIGEGLASRGRRGSGVILGRIVI